jgi:ribosomal protein S18 acetylase RimI-like enzyme
MIIRRVARDEAARLGALAADLFRIAYGPTHPEPTLSRYLSESFAPHDIEARIADPASAFLVAETDEGEWSGYAELRAGGPEAGRVFIERPLPGSHPLEIVRFYVAPGHQGRGVAQDLMRACEDAAAQDAFDVIWLQAWQEASQALRFYEKSGFEKYGTAVFPFGERMDQDYLLAKPVFYC